jgi:hypothetical protein
VRTTIDLPEDLHRIASSIARDRGESLSATVAALMRRGLGGDARRDDVMDRDGFPVVSVGHVVTGDDVRSLEDE